MDNEFSLNDYNLEKVIGTGSFGIIRKAKRKIGNEIVAIKIVNKSQIKEKEREKMSQECQLLTSLNHPNILKVYAYGEDNKKYYCVMPFYERGDLDDILSNLPDEKLSPEKSFHILKQLLDAVEYLHNNNIIHRDIKPENIFVINENMDIVLADFGFWTRQNPNDPNLTEYIGTPLYAAPELLMGKPYRGRPVDIWAIGVTFFQIFTGEFPFDANTSTNSNPDLSSTRRLIDSIIKDTPNYSFVKQRICVFLFRDIFKKNPQDRLSIPEIKHRKCYLTLKENYETQ